MNPNQTPNPTPSPVRPSVGTPNPLVGSNSQTNPQAAPAAAPRPASAPNSFAAPNSAAVRRPVSTPTSASSTPLNSNPAISSTSEEPTFSDQSSVVGPKKKHTGRIVAIVIVVILLLSGIGAAIWYFVFYSNPEKVAFDAMNNLVSAENLDLSGSVEYTNGESTLTISIDSSSDKSFSESSTIALSYQNDYANFGIALSDIFLSDGTIYIKLDGLADALDKSGFGEYIPGILGYAKEIDGQYWKISLSDFASETDFATEVDLSGYGDIYACTTTAISSLGNNNTLSDLYSKNQFLIIKTSDYLPAEANSTLYSVSLNTDRLTSFIVDSANTPVATELKNCLGQSGIEIGEIDSKAVSSSVQDLSDSLPDFYFSVSNFGHQINRVYANSQDSSATMTADFKVSYPETSNVASAPSNARPISELVEAITKMINTYSTY